MSKKKGGKTKRAVQPKKEVKSKKASRAKATAKKKEKQSEFGMEIVYMIGGLILAGAILFISSLSNG